MAGIVQGALAGYKIGDMILGSKVDGYTPIYQTRERSNAIEIAVFFALLILVVVFVIMAFKKV